MTISTTDLRCERSVDPIGIGTPAPRLTWRIVADDGETDVVQQASQVHVGVDGDVIWDSGRIEGRGQQVLFGEEPLSSRTRHWWRARVWTSAGDSDWSDRAAFETGLLHARDWSARMIAARAETPVVRFRTSLELGGDVASARLYITAHGAFRAKINGHDVGDEVLAPGWTSYLQRLPVRTHDVTSLLQSGRNEIEVLVAPGWFSGRLGWGEPKPIYAHHTGVLAQLEATLSNGEIVRCSTDEHWKAESTGYLLAEIYDGETFDARLAEAEGTPTDVEVVGSFDIGSLVTPMAPAVRPTEVVAPVTKTIVEGGGVQLDFGQNLVGHLRINVRGALPGAERRVASL